MWRPIPPWSVTATPGDVASSSAAPFASPANRAASTTVTAAPGAGAAAACARGAPRTTIRARPPARAQAGFRRGLRRGPVLGERSRARARRPRRRRGTGGRIEGRAMYSSRLLRTRERNRREKIRGLLGGRSPGSRGRRGYALLGPAAFPSQTARVATTCRTFSPATVAGPRRNSTGFPVPPSGCCEALVRVPAKDVKRSLARRRAAVVGMAPGVRPASASARPRSCTPPAGRERPRDSRARGGRRDPALRGGPGREGPRPGRDRRARAARAGRCLTWSVHAPLDVALASEASARRARASTRYAAPSR